MKRIAIYDTTLRDGAQGEGISFSVEGKVRVAKRLDAFGVDYIEGGFAASNPKDMAFFKEIKKEKLAHAKIAAFGSTRRANTPVAKDAGTRALLEADTPVVTIFGKSWRLHVKEVLRTTDEENLAMIADTVRHLKQHGKEVIYDAEHFFDGYKDDREYALKTLRAALDAGADLVVPCDTNGGALPHEVFSIIQDVIRAVGPKVGIHTHNDGETGVANSLEAVRAGAVQVQGTTNGYGERTGNANLTSIIPNLVLKMGCDCLREGSLKQLREVSQFVDEIANVRPNRKAAFVGDSAFAHKAGMHVDAVRKVARSFEHIDPAVVGNERRVLVSELSGASNIFLKAVEMGMNLDKTSPEVKEILRELERQEKEGYEFEAAEGSFKLLVQKVLKAHRPFFTLEGFRVIVEKRHRSEPCLSEATVKLTVNGETEHTVAEGDGPVDALNSALRNALTRFYPQIADVVLTDYRVRILDPETATAAKTRVLIESSDGRQTWGTVGVSGNIIEASWEALVDSVEYKLFLEEKKAGKKNG
ncbi:MAG TPA: citramalate synthase [Kiritimatiellia bacterium]|nr:citramalate synthase [Spirochaetales bacterium]HRZ12988.1 citramalate synthase [Kiritimatiellia bacterium]HSA18402.1 citramalate synthase [Kiritimatiellia bacterium]